MNNDSVYGAELTPFSVDEILQSTDFSCAIKCQQLILNMFGQNVTEQDLINEAFDNGWATTNGTYLSDIGKLLDAHGVGVQVYEEGNVCTLMHELNQGHQVIVSVDSGELWSPVTDSIEDMFSGDVPDHAIIVSGIDVSDPANVMVTVTDPGSGQFTQYPYDQFVDAWRDSGCHMVATTEAPAVPELENLDDSFIAKLDAFVDDTLSVFVPDDGDLQPSLDQCVEVCASLLADDEVSYVEDTLIEEPEMEQDMNEDDMDADAGMLA